MATVRRPFVVITCVAGLLASPWAVAEPATSPSLTLSRSIFPASDSNCRMAASRAGTCEHTRYSAFALTYVPGGEAPEWATTGGRLRISFAYKSRGKYRTEYTYTRLFAWPPPQFDLPKKPNYTTVDINDGIKLPGKPELSLDRENRVIVVLNRLIAPSSEISVTFGDKKEGSRGYAVPPIAYDIDLVVEQDLDGDGTFELVGAAAPVLRVVGTTLDAFNVIAPSTPPGRTAPVIVQALQGHDHLDTNQYLVQNYTGTVTFSCTDPGATLPPDFTFGPNDRGVAHFDVTFATDGIHRIMVRANASGVEGTSNPIRVGTTFGQAEGQVYWGVLHQHTNIGGHGAQTEEFAYDYARRVAGLGFLALSQHCERVHFHWPHANELAEDFYEPGSFVTFPAYEWATRNQGHRHVVYRDAGMECFCSGSENPMAIEAATLEGLLAAVSGTDALVLLHHMAWKYSAWTRSPDDDVELGPVDSDTQRLYEVYSQHGSSERYDNAPYHIHGNAEKIHQWGQEKKVYFQDAIALGYRFGVTSDGDDHMGRPGGHIAAGESESPEDYDMQFARQGITAIYADALTRDGVWNALYARRTYGTTGARILLDFRINGHPMGEEIVAYGLHPAVSVDVIGTDVIHSVEIVKDGARTVHSVAPESDAVSFGFIDRDVVAGETHSYYVRVVQNDLHHAWSSPIWVTVYDDTTETAAPIAPGARFEILSVSPNPFNASLAIVFTLPENEGVTAEVWSIDGRRVAVIADNVELPSGINRLGWDGHTSDGGPAASGVYFVRVTTRSASKTTRAILLK